MTKGAKTLRVSTDTKSLLSKKVAGKESSSADFRSMRKAPKCSENGFLKAIKSLKMKSRIK